MNNGWVKAYRKTIHSKAFANPEVFKLWMLCLYQANHKATWVNLGGISEPIRVKPGEFITGRNSLHEDYYQGQTKGTKDPLTVWRWLQKLEKWGSVNIKSNSKYSLVQVVKWDKYQNNNGSSVGDEQVMNKSRTTGEQVMYTNKNDNNANNDKNNTSSSDSGESDKVKDKESKIEKLARLNNMDTDLANTSLGELSTERFKVPQDKSDVDDGLNYLTMAFFEALPEVVKSDKPTRNKKFVKWRNNIRLMHKQDERSLKEIHEAIEDFKNNDFWHNTCQSTGNLRKNYLNIIKSKDKYGTRKKRIPSRDGFDMEQARKDLSGVI